MAAKIRKGDKVIVLAGRDKGRTGEVISVRPADGPRSGARRQHGQAPPAQTAQQEGGIISKEGPDASVQSGAGRSRRTASRPALDSRFVGEGETRKKVRFAKRSGVEIDG